MNDQTTEPALNRDEIITQPEVEKLIEGLIVNAEFEPYAVYGLMFLFGSIKKLFESGREKMVENIWLAALIKLYALSPNVYEAINRATEDIHIHYRQADWTIGDQDKIAAPFIGSEYGEPGGRQSVTGKVSDSSDRQAASPALHRLAAQISDVLTNPDLPPRLYHVLTDELAIIGVEVVLPVGIPLDLKSKLKVEENAKR